LNERGRQAETFAAAFLAERGLRVIERNWRCRFGEIDLVARDGKSLVFVEVRARSRRGYGGAAESIDAAKRAKLIAAAGQYLARVGLATPCRFDAILIDGPGEPRWIRDAFGVD
jgi:putative endonuclease